MTRKITEKEVSNLYKLSGVSQKIYLFAITEFRDESFLSYQYHIVRKFSEKMREYGVMYSESSLKKGVMHLIKNEYFKRSENGRGFYKLPQ